jgi:tripartite ATP-independent transporter DctM subunit
MVAIIGIVVMLLIMFLRLPVGFAMALAGFLGISYFLSPQAAFHILATDIWGQFSSYGLSVIPLFIFMGYICFNSGISVRLYDTAYKWVGQVRGGIAMATIVADEFFAAICGSNTATAATMGTVALPQMKKYGYDPVLSTGTVATGGTLGVVIPPSVVLIVIGLQTEQSIAKLFLGGIFPGIVLGTLFLITIYILCRWKPQLGPAGAKTSLKEKIAAFPGILEVLVLFVLVLGGLYAGWFTPTEAGAAGAFGAIVIALVRREFTWQRFTKSILETLRTSCMVMVLVTGAVIFGRFLTATRLPFFLADWASALPIPPVSILAVVLFIYLVGGCLMDALGFLVVTIPIFFPLLIALGYDPIWTGIMLMMVTTVGAITPPVGVNVYVVKGLVPDIPLETIFKGVSFFLVACILSLILLVVFPQIALFLPSLMK